MSFQRRVALLIAIWSVPAWLMVAESRTIAHLGGAPTPPLRLSVPTLIEWYLWVLLTPAVLRLGTRFPLNRWPIAPRNVVIHALAVLFVSLLNAVMITAARPLLHLPLTPLTFWSAALRLAIGWLPFAAVIYGAVIAAGSALDLARQLSERETAAARLSAQLAHARLDAIHARIHPHFMFNALHSVAALVRTGDRDDAVRVVSDLSDLLREVLAQDTPDLVPLSLELSFVRRYLAIESVRFSDRLRIEWNVDEAVADAAVPPLLVQTLVENAVRHGISRSGTAGRLQIVARNVGGIVEIVVTDDGPGFAALGSTRSGGTGFGIDAARQRLRALLGEGADLRVTSRKEIGTVAHVRMPLRRHSSSPTAAVAVSS